MSKNLKDAVRWFWIIVRIISGLSYFIFIASITYDFILEDELGLVIILGLFVYLIVQLPAYSSLLLAYKLFNNSESLKPNKKFLLADTLFQLLIIIFLSFALSDNFEFEIINILIYLIFIATPIQLIYQNIHMYSRINIKYINPEIINQFGTRNQNDVQAS